ncbi:hypothetical protein [Desulfitobacterium metallireducens]|uniref:Uncharacterized protein n=1 Tax=Desulfitobacterium metallireducens DSM 15288 TaxID=871968 RepID=W0EHR4_9FIRM|nr:hypothetical protein [Desulfitobacterium metallireducens]AHF08616.1 hypothetical protein DESME_09710 [Desulfitobacterium metallireducens DSM 15288]
MSDHDYSVNEALALFKKSLEHCGLENVHIAVNSHGLTLMQSVTLVQHLLAEGFGQNVTPASQDYPYSNQSGHYSWLNVAQGSDQINLFYDTEVAS